MDKKTLLLSLILFVLPWNLEAKISFEEVLQLGLNVLIIETDNCEEPNCEYVSAPEGCVGKSIINATKVPGSLKIFSPDGEEVYNSGDYEKNESGMTIKIRGNTSAYSAKKPFKIKLQKKADLLLRGDKKFNDKNWVLLNDNHLKLYTGFEVSRLIEEDWTPSGTYVNVIFNNEYRGIYYLTESIERNENSRINVSEEGFIVEHDAYWWKENGEYISSLFNPNLNYTFKYPDFEDISKSNLNGIAEILGEYEKSLNDETYVSTIDMESFAKWILGHDILGTWDGSGANLYLSRYDLSPGSKLKAGPLWDFDTIEMNEEKWSGVHTIQHRFDKLFEGNSSFRRVYSDLWKSKGEEIYKGILSLMEDYRDEAKWEAYKLSSEATSEFWGSANNANDAADRDEQWFLSRFEWLKTQLGDFDDNIDAGINEITDSSGNKLFDVFNLQGIKVLSKVTKEEINSLQPGMYIINRKKFVIK